MAIVTDVPRNAGRDTFYQVKLEEPNGFETIGFTVETIVRRHVVDTKTGDKGAMVYRIRPESYRLKKELEVKDSVLSGESPFATIAFMAPPQNRDKEKLPNCLQLKTKDKKGNIVWKDDEQFSISIPGRDVGNNRKSYIGYWINANITNGQANTGSEIQTADSQEEVTDLIF